MPYHVCSPRLHGFVGPGEAATMGTVTLGLSPLSRIWRKVSPDYEACDDANIDPLDACTNACALARCGDGLARVRM